jgi:hypothetical protein
MQKSPLIGISITAVILLVLSSLTNVIGYQVVQSSNQKIIKDEVEQTELLFQTILNILNNKKIQKIIQNSELKGGLERYPQTPGVKLLFINPIIHINILLSLSPVFTKSYLKYTYNIGVRLSRTFSTLKIHSMVERFRVNSQEIQKEIATVIEKNDALNKEIKQLLDLPCNCEKDKTANWSFPVLCTILFPLFIILIAISIISHQVIPFIEILGRIGLALHCFWYPG